MRRWIVAGALALMACGPSWAETGHPDSERESTMTHDATKAVTDAWVAYDRKVEAIRKELLAHRYASHPQLRAQGLYFLKSLETVAFNFYIAPRQQYPALYTQSFFMPFELTWGTQNPDFLNHNGLIDGAHTYRIWGNAKGNYWTTIQIFKGFWGDEAMDMLGHVDFDDIPKAGNGDFEIFLGPNPPADTGGKTWVRLDPQAQNVMMAIREVYWDWEREKILDIHIETLDRDADAPMWFDEEELGKRIGKAARFIEYCWKFSSGQMTPGKTEPPINSFVTDTTAGQHGGNPVAAYVPMHYEIGPEDALIIEMTPITARYWGFQTSSVWGQTNDYSYHQSSLNGQQLRADADGKVRLVLSLSDPGVPNWLDPVGIPIGSVLLRWYKAQGTAVPTVTRVPFGEVRAHLPADTPTVTPQQRAAQLEKRARASLRRFKQ